MTETYVPFHGLNAWNLYGMVRTLSQFVRNCERRNSLHVVIAVSSRERRSVELVSVPD